MMPSCFPLAAEPFIPHRPPMRLVESLLSCGAEQAEVEVCVETGNLLLGVDGRLESLTAVEMLAQAQAVAQGYRDRQAGKLVRMGYLVGIRNFEEFDQARLGERLRIRVVTKVELGDFALVEGEIRAGSRLLAQGELKLWIDSGEGENG